MSVILAHCRHEDCPFTWTGRSPGFRYIETRHVDESAPDHGLAVMRERWPWLPWLVAANVIWITLSVIAATDPYSGLWFFLPEVWVALRFPVMVVMVLLPALVCSAFYTAYRLPGSRAAWRFFAAMTMSGAVTAAASTAMILCTAACLQTDAGLHGLG